jgi:hypothetical protein
MNLQHEHPTPPALIDQALNRAIAPAADEHGGDDHHAQEHAVEWPEMVRIALVAGAINLGLPPLRSHARSSSAAAANIPPRCSSSAAGRYISVNNTAWLRARGRAVAKYQERLGEPAPEGLRTLRAHDLRDTVGRRLGAAGMAHETRQAILGYKSASITTHYSAATAALAKNCFRRRRNDSERRTAIDPINSAQVTGIWWRDLILKTIRPPQSDGPQYTQR